MLNYFRRRAVADDLPALNVLVLSSGGGKFAIKVSTVQIEPAPPPQPVAPVSAMAELIIGSALGLTRQQIDASAAALTTRGNCWPFEWP